MQDGATESNGGASLGEEETGCAGQEEGQHEQQEQKKLEEGLCGYCMVEGVV